MLITVPASAAGMAGGSVLDLEPLIEFARQCRPDAVSLLPPLGADDQPNGPALLAIRERLEAQGLRVVAGSWHVAPGTPVTEPGCQAEQSFEARALVTALGEAGLEPLTVRWGAPVDTPAGEDALLRFLERVLEEAGRSQVRIAVDARLAVEGLLPGGPLLRQLDSPLLGVHCVLDDAPEAETARVIESFGSRLLALFAGPAAETASGGDPFDWSPVLTALDGIRYEGPLILEGRGSPIEYATAVGYVRAVLDHVGRRVRQKPPPGP